MKLLIDSIGITEMLERTAEKASELSAACLKMTSTRRGNNPFARSESVMVSDIEKSMASVFICLQELIMSEFVDEDSVNANMNIEEKQLRDRYGDSKNV